MSAPITKQHLKIIDEIRVGDRSMRFDITDAQAAQLIADSEARACDQFRAEVERLKHGTVAQFKDAFIEELKRENAELREWQAGVIANERLHHAERKDAIARAEKAEAELAKERARNAGLVPLLARWLKMADDCHHEQQEVGHSEYNVTAGLMCDTRAAIDAAMTEENK